MYISLERCSDCSIYIYTRIIIVGPFNALGSLGFYFIYYFFIPNSCRYQVRPYNMNVLYHAAENRIATYRIIYTCYKVDEWDEKRAFTM